MDVNNVERRPRWPASLMICPGPSPRTLRYFSFNADVTHALFGRHGTIIRVRRTYWPPTLTCLCEAVARAGRIDRGDVRKPCLQWNWPTSSPDREAAVSGRQDDCVVCLQKEKTMFSWALRVGLLSIVSGSLWLTGSTAFAAGSDDGTSDDGSKTVVTVTETETTAKLKGQGSQASASGCAESSTVTVSNSSTNTSKTNSTLSIGVKKLSLADGSVITFAIKGNAVGTATVKKGKASLKLSTKKGDSVPTVNAGDVVKVIDSDGKSTDLSGNFGAASTHTES